MPTTLANIDRLRIATSCPIGWEQMTGDNRVRFCDVCRLNVYNISELSRTEAETLIASTEGRLCARLFRRADGTILTKDCPVGLRALRRRVGKRAAAMFAAIVSLSAAAFGQQPADKQGKTSGTSQTRITQTNSAGNQLEQGLTGTIVDPAGAVIPVARVTLTSSATKEKKVTSADDTGRFQFASLTPGDYSVTIEATAFKTLLLTNLVIEKGKVINVDTALETTGVYLTGVVALEEELLLLDTPVSPTIIRRLPIRN